MTSQQASFQLPDTSKIMSVEDYTFEPIKGYPMLQWQGKRPFTSTQYYPAQLREVHGPAVEGWRSKIYWGDNLQVMSHLLKDYRGKITLVYIDPPFDSQADYRKVIRVRGNRVTSNNTAFEEKQYTDIWTNDEYLQFIYERLILVRELLSNHGSIYLHCDSRKVHHLRCLMDEVFGQSNFQSEIAWKRSTPKGNMTRGYGTAYDTILYFSNSDRFVWNQLHLPHREDYIKAYYTNHEEGTGRRYQLTSLLSPADNRPNLTYEFKGHMRVWRYTQDRMMKLDKSGRIVVPHLGAMPREKRYLDEMAGTPLPDLWIDIPPVNSQASEREDYPTQKPEKLLERVINVSCLPGDIVFDCFMGSGTTQAVAMKLGRRFIGADINLGAVQITTKRLIQVAQEIETALKTRQVALVPNDENEGPPEPSVFYAGFEVYNVNHYDIFRNPVEAKDLLLQALEINPLETGHLFDGEKDGRLWKIMPVNRIATRQDLNELITGFDYRAFDRRQAEHPHQPVEKITLVCMGHEPDLAAVLAKEVEPYKLDVQVVDILRDKQDLQFKREAEARMAIQDGHLVIDRFYPMNLLQKLSLQAEAVDDWRELVESVMIDWNYDGAVFQPAVVDIPEKEELVSGRYPIPADAGTIRVKITDLLSESLEQEVSYG